jgi:SagB-type dehydrogenase family enzyme
MTNRDIEAAWNYHNATKHSVARLRANPHSLDWENKPRPFKVYPKIEPIPLPREVPMAAVPALTALARKDVTSSGQAVTPDLVSLARLLHFSAGITRRRVYPSGEEVHFRAAACTGALYHIDIYLICGDLPGLSAGVYHFGPHNFALHQLRAGDFRGTVVEATGTEPSIQHAPAILACTSTYWRNSWKYQARTYRHCFWDCGTVLANLLAVTAADELPTRIVCGFVDDRINALLGVDPAREAALALVSLGHDPHSTPPAAPDAPALSLETLPLSPHEVDYPLIREMHAASSLRTIDEARSWHDAAAVPVAETQRVASRQLFPLRPLQDPMLPVDSIDEVITRRGSSRHFSHQSIGFDQLSTILRCASSGAPADFGECPTDTYLIVNAVHDLPAGAYAYRHADAALELLRPGSFRREAGYLGLGQELPADASVNIYFLSNLEPILARWGNRGYRVAQLDAALRGGRCYLAAYALGLGATGLTFFDDEVADFFSPEASAKEVMFLIATGRRRKTSRKTAGTT